MRASFSGTVIALLLVLLYIQHRKFMQYTGEHGSLRASTLEAASIAPPPPPPRLLIAVKSSIERYSTVIRASMETWVQQKHPQIKVVFVGDGPDPEGNIIDSQCPPPYHMLCCKHSVLLELFYNTTDDFQWLFIVDDDCYIFPRQVLTIARNVLPPQLDRIDSSNYGCTTPDKKCKGYCGGGGQMINRATFMSMVARYGSFQAMKAEYLRICHDDCSQLEDVAWGEMTHRMNISTIELPKSADYPYHGLDWEYRPALLHHVNESAMRHIHDRALYHRNGLLQAELLYWNR